jgi:hypothetical protein
MESMIGRLMNTERFEKREVVRKGGAPGENLPQRYAMSHAQRELGSKLGQRSDKLATNCLLMERLYIPVEFVIASVRVKLSL